MAVAADIGVDPEKIVFQPTPGSQESVLSCPALEVLFHGTRGGGKSLTLIADYLQHVGQGYGPDWHGLIVRLTYPQLSDLILKSQSLIPRIFPGAKYNGTDHRWTFPEGEILDFGYLSRVLHYEQNFHGHEYQFLGFDEMCNWPTMDLYEKLMTCLRTSRKGVPLKVRATANPAGPGHNAVKRHFRIGEMPNCQIFDIEGSTRCHIFSTLDENFHLLEADPNYIKRLDALKETNPVYYEAWRLGSWDVVAGGAFDDIWEPTIHVIDPFVFPIGWKVTRTFDWGSSSPFAVLWHAISDGLDFDVRSGHPPVRTTPNEFIRRYPEGTIFTFAEWYGATDRGEGLRMDAHEIARGIQDREEYWEDLVEPGPADSAIYDSDRGVSIADQMAAVGVNWERANKTAGSRINGFQVMRTTLLASKKQPMEEPGWFLMRKHPRFPGYGCPIWIDQLPTLTRDEKNLEDVDTTQEDHFYDAQRYLQNSERSIEVEEGI